MKTGIEKIWDVIMATNGVFTRKYLDKKCAYASPTQINLYLKNLLNAAIVEATEGGYKLVRPSREAPRFTKKGERFIPYCRQDYMWRAMNMLNKFDAKSLARQASTKDVLVTRDQARRYLNALADVGIVKEVAHRGEKAKNYVLVKKLGGKPPVIKRVVTVYDPNSHQTFCSKEKSNG